MSSSPVDRMSGASTPTLLAMSSYSSNRLHEELNGLKRWRQMYDSAMNEKNEELQKLQLINQRQAQSLNDSIIQIEQQTTTINSMKQNEILLEKKVAKLEELHHVLKKNVTKLEKTVSQCEFVRVDLERLYEHQERNVKSLADRVDSTIESKLQNLQSQLKSVEQLYEQARIDLQKQIQENNQSQIYIVELTNKLVANENEINQLQLTNTNSQFKINELNEQINQSKQTIELIQNENQSKLHEKNQEIEQLQKRIDSLVLKIDGNQEEIFKLQEQINEFHEKSSEIHQLREKQSEQLLEQIKTSTNEIEELKSKNTDLQNELNQFHLQIDKTQEDLQKQIADYARQSIEYEHRFEEQSQMIHEKQTIFNELKEKHDDLLEKIDLSEEEILQLTKENEELRVQNHMLIQESDERNEQIKQKDVIVEATNIEIGEKDKEIEELKVKVISLEERLSKNQNLLTSLRSSMGEKDAKIKRLEQGPLTSQSSPRPTAIRRTGPITHPLATQTKTSLSNNTTKPNPREKRMLPPPAASDLTSTPKKIVRLSQTKAAIDQAHALEKSFSIVADDDRDEIASNTSVASLFEYLKKI